MTLLKYARKRYVCEKKGNTGTRKRMSTKSVSSYKKLLTTQVENLHAVSHFNTKHYFSALNYAQDFGTTMKESLQKNYEFEGLHSRKIELSLVKYFHASVSTFNYVSPIGANSTKRS